MKRSFRELSVAIRRQETPTYSFLYKIAKALRDISMPTIKPVHNILYHEWSIRTSIWHSIWRVVYYEPLFKSQCIQVGSKFRMEYAGNGIARIFGDLQIYIGSNVIFFDNIGLAGLKVIDKPELHIGDNTYIGPFVRFQIGKEIRVGNNCLIGSRLITDNPGHSLNDVINRLKSSGGTPIPEEIRPVRIGDFCMLGLDTYVTSGVTVGDGVVAIVGANINKDVPPFCIVAGNPARIVRKLDIPEELIDIVGKERYESYIEAHKAIDMNQ